jgi:hypothetical protein
MDRMMARAALTRVPAGSRPLVASEEELGVFPYGEGGRDGAV